MALLSIERILGAVLPIEDYDLREEVSAAYAMQQQAEVNIISVTTLSRLREKGSNDAGDQAATGGAAEVGNGLGVLSRRPTNGG
jgi:hypothetical protein